MSDLSAHPAALLAPLIALAFSAGINLYATGLIAGILAHSAFVTLPTGLEWLGHPLVMVVFGVMFALEFFADKIRFVDTVWDVLHSVIRPVGAIALTFGLAKSLPEWSVPLLLLAGTTALAAHTAKSSISLGLKAVPPVGINTLRSLVEDGLAMSLTWLAFTHPWIGLGLVLTLTALFVLFAPRLLSLAVFWLLSPLRALQTAIMGDKAAPVREYDSALNTIFDKTLPLPARLEFIHPVFIVRGKGVGVWRRGHLALDENSIYLIRTGWFGLRVFTVKAAGIHHLRLREKAFHDQLEINFPKGRIIVLIHATVVAALADALENMKPDGATWEIHESGSASEDREEIAGEIPVESASEMELIQPKTAE